jgi:hypothetical protein
MSANHRHQTKSPHQRKVSAFGEVKKFGGDITHDIFAFKS